MKTAAALLAALILVGGQLTARTALAYEDVLSKQVTGHIQPSGETTQQISALHRLAVALSSGSDVMRALHGPSSEYEDEKDRLNPPIPGMECDIDRIVSYVSCFSSLIGSEEEADNLFTRLVGELKASLPSDRWIGANGESGVDSIRTYVYQDQRSPAHIDIDIIPRANNSYIVSLYGWSYSSAMSLN